MNGIALNLFRDLASIPHPPISPSPLNFPNESEIAVSPAERLSIGNPQISDPNPTR